MVVYKNDYKIHISCHLMESTVQYVNHVGFLFVYLTKAANAVSKNPYMSTSNHVLLT